MRTFEKSRFNGTLCALAVAASMAIAPAAAASPPVNSPAFTPFGYLSFFCGDGQFTEQPYILGPNTPDGWWNKLPEHPPPPGEKLLPQAPVVRDARNVVRIDIDNPCSFPLLLHWGNEALDELTGLVLPHTSVTLDRDDLMLAGLWQWDWQSFGGGSCYSGGCFETPHDFLITPHGIVPSS